MQSASKGLSRPRTSWVTRTSCARCRSDATRSPWLVSERTPSEWPDRLICVVVTASSAHGQLEDEQCERLVAVVAQAVPAAGRVPDEVAGDHRQLAILQPHRPAPAEHEVVLLLV